MLQKLFLTMLEISITSSAVILMLLLISPLLFKRYGSRLHCLVWLVLALRLVIPFNMPLQNAININLFSVAEAQAAQYDWFLPNPAQVIEREQEVQGQNALTEREVNRYKPIRITPVSLAAIIWMAGMALFLIYHLGAYFYTLHKLRRWSTPIQDDDILRRFESVKKDLSIQNEVRLYKSSKAASPLLMGFINPRIVLPEQMLSPEQLDFMLRHELWHLKRGDLWYKLLMLLANAVHWFNPFVWLMDRQAGLDTELACDADVLRGIDCNGRREYGYTILSFMEQGWRCKTPLTSRFYVGRKQMKQRFYNITDTSGKKRGTALFCAVSLVIVLVGCTVHAAAPEQTVPTQATATSSLYEGVKITGTSKIADERPGTYEYEITELQPGNYAVAIEPQSGASDEIDRIIENIEWSKNPYANGEMAWPFPNNTSILAPFGENPQIPNNHHTGLDIAGKRGDTVIAANDGTVMYVSTEWTQGAGYGMYIIIDHGGEISTLYAHCSKILVSKGDRVVKGEKIAEAGATGFASEPHLHFEVRLAGITADPMPYITSTGFIWPTTDGFISLGVNGYPGHTGMDIVGLSEGTPVYAAAAGTVVIAQNSNVGYGKYIIIDHGSDYQTLYAHNSELYVSVGDVAAQGQVIAAIGRSGSATGHQLHFEIRHNGEILNPEDFLTVSDTNK